MVIGTVFTRILGPKSKQTIFFVKVENCPLSTINIDIKFDLQENNNKTKVLALILNLKCQISKHSVSNPNQCFLHNSIANCVQSVNHHGHKVRKNEMRNCNRL